MLSNQIKSVMQGLLQGLKALHEQGIMHRDIKPENLLFRDSGYDCVIADFGFAERINDTLLFPRCGTPGFMAPEVANLRNNSETYGFACDLFSAGVIFHQLTLGRSPFPGSTAEETLRQNKTCRIDFEALDYQRLPPTWLSLLKRLMEVDPEKRITASDAL